MNIKYLKYGRRTISIFLLSMFFVLFTKVVFSQSVPFHKGVNLANWFEHDATSVQKIRFTKFTKTDFEQLKSLGFDVIRLPIHMPSMTNGAPDYTFDPLYFELLDQVVAWSNELEMHLILDNHSSGNFGTVTDPNIGPVLKKLWIQMATHYRDASSLIYYEILNEPHDINSELWNSILQETIAQIRSVDTKHTIIVGPVNWNHINSLELLSHFTDNNLIYTFHFYEPFLFTGQGDVNSSIPDITGVPFPYNASLMPAVPAKYMGTWMEDYMKNYKNEGTVANIKQLIDIAVNFSNTRNVPVFCGEFGAFDKYCAADDRNGWHNAVRQYLEEKNIPWTMWDYHSNFGLFNKDMDYIGLFDHDLNTSLLEALGLNIPPQTERKPMVDTTGFPIYDEYVSPIFIERSYGSGSLNFYSPDANNGKYCIKWDGAGQNSSIVLDFNPDRDFTAINNKDFGLSLWIKGNNPNGNFEIRFIDSKTSDPADHPWRISKFITKSNVAWNNQWHNLIIPLNEFIETGSWDNAWFNPEGKFDIKAIEELNIATNQNAMGSYALWIDKMEIVKIVPPELSVTIKITNLPSNHPFNEDVYIAGDLNNWNPADTSYKLKLNPDNTYSIILKGNGTTNYKFTRGSWATVEKGSSCNEISNRSLNFEGSSTISSKVLNWADLCGGSHTATANVSVIDAQFEMPQLSRTRKVWIYLPTGYETSSKNFPVLYMHDGQNLFDSYYSFAGEWGIDETMNSLINKGDAGCIVVGIDNGGGERINEYSPWINPTYGGGDGDLYARFMVETLKPYIDQHYRTLSDRGNTAIMGSSMGALISFYTGLKYQNVFSKIGIFSPSFWFSEESYTFASSTPKTDSMRIYFLGGGLEEGVIEDCNRMITTLSSNGYQMEEMHLESVAGGSHNEAFWKNEFSDAYLWLFSKKSVNNAINENRFEIFPNPIDKQINVHVTSDMVGETFTIFNLTGIAMLSGKIISEDNAILLENLPKGNYMFCLGKNQRRSFKLQKE